MTRYYHKWWPTCPCCHEPHIYSPSSRKFQISYNEITCGNLDCRARFHDRVVPPREYYDKVSITIGNSSPLFWEMKPNTIEKAYLDWISKKPIPKGLFVITWPWNNVKFIPLLAFIALKNNDIDRPIIVYSKNNKKIRTLKGLRSPAPNVLWKNMMFLDEEKENPILKSARKDLFKNIKNMIITYELEVTRYKRDAATFTKFGYINDDQVPTDAKNVKRYLEKRKGNIKYRKDWQHEILTNWNTIFFPKEKDILEVFYLRDFPDSKIDNKKVTFIRSSRYTLLNKELLSEKIINPYLVIIENVEEICLHKYYSYDFYRFLQAIPDDCIVLMFSTKPRLRFLIKDLVEKVKKEIVYHCWDSPERMEYLIKSNWEQSKFPNPGTSLKEEIRREYYGRNIL